MRKATFSPLSRRLFAAAPAGALLLLLLVGMATGVATAASVPATATPGAVQPKLDDGIDEPFVYPNTVPSTEPSTTAPAAETDAPRMRVRGFRIEGVKPHPELAITQTAIEQLVKKRAQELVAGEAAQGFTLASFADITATISKYYRERGFFLARAYIPEQKVSDGIVSIDIIEGFLDQVVYRGNQLYSDEQLDDLFGDLLGKPVFLPTIENAIFIANDFPGLNASALFGPGLKPGSAAIQLDTIETPSSGFFSFDNYGSFYTGELRLRGNYVANNLLGQADRVATNVILTLDPENSVYVDVAYEQPVLGYDYLAGGSYRLNTFDVGGNLQDLGINGKSSIISGYMTYLYRRKRSERMTGTLDLSLKNAESRVIDTLDSQDKLTVLTARALYAGTSWSSSGAYQQIDVSLSVGLPGFLGSMDSNGDGKSGRTGGSDKLAGGDFTKLNLEYLRVQKITDLQRLTFKFSMQNSSDLLTSMEQFSLGGPDTVRAYPVAEALMDSAWLVSVEWRADASPEIPQTWLNGLQLLAFFDYAKGSLNDPLNNDVDTVKLSGFGFGAEIEPYKKLKAKLQIAFDLGDTPSDNQSLPFYFSLQYHY